MHHAGMEYLLDDTFFDLANMSKEVIEFVQDRLSVNYGSFVDSHPIVIESPVCT